LSFCQFIEFIYYFNLYYLIEKVNTLLRLTEDGTNSFESYNNNDKKIFLKNLAKGLADNIPLNDPSQIEFNNYEFDKSINKKQLLLSLSINPSNNNKDINVEQIINTLDTMIRNLEVTPLSSNNHTKYLDNGYGCIINSK